MNGGIKILSIKIFFLCPQTDPWNILLILPLNGFDINPGTSGSKVTLFSPWHLDTWTPGYCWTGDTGHWRHGTVVCSTGLVLYSKIMYCTVLYCTALYWNVLHYYLIIYVSCIGGAYSFPCRVITAPTIGLKIWVEIEIEI